MQQRSFRTWTLCFSLLLSILAVSEAVHATVRRGWPGYSGGRRKLFVRIVGDATFRSAVLAGMQRWNSANESGGAAWRFCETTEQDYQVFIREAPLPRAVLGETASRRFLDGTISHCNVSIAPDLHPESRDTAISHELGHCMGLDHFTTSDIDDVMNGGGSVPTPNDIAEALASDKDPPPCPYAIASPDAPYLKRGTSSFVRLEPQAGSGISHDGVLKIGIESLTGPDVSADPRSIQWDASSITAAFAVGRQADHNEVIQVSLAYRDHSAEYTGILTITDGDAPKGALPHAVAGQDLSVPAGFPVLLDGRQSFHDAPGVPFSGGWLLKAADGTPVADLFTEYGEVELPDGAYEAALEVVDHYGRASRASIAVKVGGPPPSPECLANVSTGFDEAAGAAIPEGQRDDDYIALGAPALVGGPAQGFPIPPWISNDARSAWISAALDARLQPGAYTYEARYQIPAGFDASRAALLGQWAADDQAALVINGQASGLSVTGSTAFTPFPPGAGQGLFLTGENVLQFRVSNGGQPTIRGNPSGLRVDACVGIMDLCPAQGDTHAMALSVDPPGGPPGLYTVTAEALDDGGDPIRYVFFASDGLHSLSAGPKGEGRAELYLGAGDWTILVRADDDPACGDEAPDAMLSTRVRVVAPSGGQVASDANQDGRLDISDASSLLGHLFLGKPARLPCGNGTLGDAGNLVLLDANGDGRVDLSDAVYELSYLFLGTPPPVRGVLCEPLEGCPAVCPISQDAGDPALLKPSTYVGANCGDSGEIYTNKTGADMDVVLSFNNLGACDVEITSGSTKFTASSGGLNSANHAFRVKNGDTIKYQCKALQESQCQFIYDLRRLGVGRGPDSPVLPNTVTYGTYFNRPCTEKGTLFTNNLDRALDLVLTLSNIGECDVKTMAGGTSIDSKSGSNARSTTVRLKPGESWTYECSALADKKCEFYWSVGELGIPGVSSPSLDFNTVSTISVDGDCFRTGTLFKNDLPDAMDLSIKVINTGYCEVTISVTGAGDVLKTSGGKGKGSESETVVVKVPSGGEVTYTCASSVDTNKCIFSCFIRQVPAAAAGADGIIALGGLQDATIASCGTARGEIFVNRLAAEIEVKVRVANNGQCPVKVFLDGAEVLKADPTKSETKDNVKVPSGGKLTYACQPSSQAGSCLFIYVVFTSFGE